MKTLNPNPFLNDNFHIKWSELKPENIEEDINIALKNSNKEIEKICNLKPQELTLENTFLALENSSLKLNDSWGLVSHLDSVCNSESLRKVYNLLLPKVSDFYSKIPLNEKLWTNLKAYSEKPQDNLTQIQKRLISETIIDYKANGADLPKAQKNKLAEIKTKLTKLTQKFSENNLDSQNAWELMIHDENQLKGLPENLKNSILEDAIAKGKATKEKPAWRLTLKAPVSGPAMTYLDNSDLRKKLWKGVLTIGNIEGFDNTNLINEILNLRQEMAELLGKPHFADYTTQQRMAKTGQNALDFVEKLHKRIKNTLQSEFTELEKFKAKSTNSDISRLAPWETTYWIEKLNKEKFNFDEEDLRPYFEKEKVFKGLFELVEKLYNLKITKRDTICKKENDSFTINNEPSDAIEVWNEEVEYFDIYNNTSQDNSHIGSFYMDWYPREEKRSGAWMNHLKTGQPPTSNKKREPHLGLICGNMTSPVEGKSTLFTHREVETIFHEFGHLLHHLLGNVSIKSLNGINVVWDFVELPSQIMENFCWERKSLDLFALHHETGEPIPDSLLENLQKSRHFMSGYHTMRQLSLGKIDLELHLNYKKYANREIEEVIDEILDDGYRPTLSIKSPSIIKCFGHIFGDPVGYAAGYYSYKWSEMLDADTFTLFKSDGVISEKVGQEFREKILSKGNSEDAAILFKNFMGREPSLDALLERAGL